MAEADNKYRNGKVYQLVYKDKRYIGSTTRTLEDRYSEHKDDCNLCSSKELFKMAKADGGIVAINLLEDYPCASKQELEVRERFYMELCQDRVNRKIPGRGWVDYYQANRDNLIAYQLEYRSLNKDKVAARKAKWYQANKDTIVVQKAEHYQANKDRIIERVSEYYQVNKDTIATQRAVKVKCECGVTYTRSHKARHDKSKPHIDYLRD